MAGLTVPRHVKRARRAMLEPVEVIDRPWLIDTLIPAITVSLILWAAFLIGACSPRPEPAQWEPFDAQRAEYEYHTNNDHYAYPPLGYGVVVWDTYYEAWPLRSWEW